VHPKGLFLGPDSGKVQNVTKTHKKSFEIRAYGCNLALPASAGQCCGPSAAFQPLQRSDASSSLGLLHRPRTCLARDYLIFTISYQRLLLILIPVWR